MALRSFIQQLFAIRIELQFDSQFNVDRAVRIMALGLGRVSRESEIPLGKALKEFGLSLLNPNILIS